MHVWRNFCLRSFWYLWPRVRINLFNLLKLIHRQDEFITIINFIGINRLLPPSNIPLEIKRTLITKKERVNFTNDYHSSQARIIYLDREQHGSSFKVRIDRGENIDGGREKKLVERGRGRERVSRLARRDEISIPREAVLEDGARKKPKEGCSDRGARTHFRSPPLFQTPAENVRIYNWWHVMGFPLSTTERRPKIYFSRPLFHGPPEKAFSTSGGKLVVVVIARLSLPARWWEPGNAFHAVDKREISPRENISSFYFRSERTKRFEEVRGK